MKFIQITIYLIFLMKLSFAEQDLAIHGYLSQTFVQTSDNDNYIENSTRGSLKWTEFAVNVYKSYMDFDFAAQLNMRSFGEGGFDATLDWGYGSYAVNEMIGFRLGKVRIAGVGMQNEYRDIDFSRTSILLPQSIYEENTRDLILAVQGVSLFGSYGPWRYLMSYGDLDVPDDFRLSRDIKNSLGAEDIDVQVDYDVSGLIQYETPVEGLSLTHTYHKIKVNAPISGVPFSGLTGALNSDLDIIQNTSGVTYQWEDWTFTGEHTWQKNKMDWSASSSSPIRAYADILNHLKVASVAKRRWYFLINRQMTERISSEVGYGYLNTDRRLGSSPANHRKTYSAALRYDFREALIMKLQFNMNSGYADTLEASNSIISGETPGRKWNTFLARVTFQF